MSRLADKLGNMTLDDQKIPVKLVYINGTVISDGACFNGKIAAVPGADTDGNLRRYAASAGLTSPLLPRRSR